MKEAYLRYYTPLVQHFCTTMSEGEHPGVEHLPQPFLPLFGKNYENSAFKLLIVGQDTRGWGNAEEFIARELEAPGSALQDAFVEIEDLNFRNWGKNTHYFFGFTMALLASIHGMPNWNVLKWGGHEEVLSSFSWANANAVVLWNSLRKLTKDVPRPTWEVARAASAHLNRFSHMLATLKPRVVLITYKGLDLSEFFEGFKLERVHSSDDYIDQYRIEGHEVDVFHTVHPGYMRNVGGPLSFLSKIRQTLEEAGLAPDFPDFLKRDDSPADVVQHLLRSCPKPDGTAERKYEFVGWVAEELTKHGALMSVPCLVDLANKAGYRTDYGTPYTGKRGSYRFVKGAWIRHFNLDPDMAEKIARAFLKPDFSYAYK